MKGMMKMYELKQGSARLVYALESVSEDEAKIKALAHYLNYCEDQLEQDIQALIDYYEQAKENESR